MLDDFKTCFKDFKQLSKFQIEVYEIPDEIQAHEETHDHAHEVPNSNWEQEFHWDRQHQLAFESGAIDYLGRDSWENIQKYLDQHLD